MSQTFRAEADATLDWMIESIYVSAPAARYLASSEVDRELFAPHGRDDIAHRLARIADSRAINILTKTDPVAAQRWSQYAAEEMLHDRPFLRDLTSLGMREEEVYGTDPFLATKLLQGYLYYTIEHEGPRGLFSKSCFVEYFSRKTQQQWNENIKRSPGDQAVRGALAHLNYDVNEDHTTDVWNTLMSTVHSRADEKRVLYHFRVYFALFCAYFNELARNTKPELAAAMPDIPTMVVNLAQDAPAATSRAAS